MDKFSKQKLNEQKYKQIRDRPIEPYNGDFKSEHYKEVENSAIKPTQITNHDDNYETDYKQDFDKASKDFWNHNVPEAIMKYNGGTLTANFGKEEYTVEELLERINKFIKESISNELLAKKLPIKDLAENFKSVEISLKLLAKSLNKIDEKTDIVGMAAFLHGFINTYVDNVIKRKLERDKGKITT